MVSFDRVADTFDATREAPQPQVIEALVRELAGCRLVLDLGVGTGRLARPLLGRGVNIVGVDLARRMLEVAVGKGVDRVVVGDACRLPFRSAAFDGVLAVAVMHLVDDITLLLAEARRVARRLLVTLANRWDPPDSPTDAYYDALAARGFRPKTGIDEPALHLAESIRPRTFASILATEQNTDFAELIGLFERREYSMTWDVPDDLHSATISEISERYVGHRTTRRETFLLSWDVAQFSEAALHRVRERLRAGAEEPVRRGGAVPRKKPIDQAHAP